MAAKTFNSPSKSYTPKLDGLRIRLHPTMDILFREDGAYMMTGPHLDSKWRFGTTNTSGYRVLMYNKKHYYIHRLMAETFLPNPEDKPTVDHIDRNPSNNFLSNLRWATQSEQNENSAIVLNAADYGVRFKDNPNAYKREWAKSHPESRKGSLRRYAQKKRAKQDKV